MLELQYLHIVGPLCDLNVIRRPPNSTASLATGKAVGRASVDTHTHRHTQPHRHAAARNIAQQ